MKRNTRNLEARVEVVAEVCEDLGITAGQKRGPELSDELEMRGLKPEEYGAAYRIWLSRQRARVKKIR